MDQPHDPIWRAHELTEAAFRVVPSREERAALAQASEAERPWRQIDRRDVPEPCSSLFARISRTLEHDAGFCVLSDLPFAGDEERARRLTFLIGYGLGTPVFQDAQGGRMVDIRSTDADTRDAVTYKPRADGTHVRPYETRSAFRLHADPCDVAGLFCVRAAHSGGSSTLVNARAVYERLRDTQPEHVAVLERPFYYAKPKKQGEAASYHGIPVFSWQAGHFKAHIVPDLIFASQLVPEVPRLTREQQDALVALMGLAELPEFCIGLPLRAGELLLLNNHVVWHGRAAYDDAPDKTRHLLRLWLAVPGSRPLAPVHEAWFGDTAPGALRGGYLRERLHELA